ncbi:hypothetical protein WAI453_010471 [Rhynchosporium graminicola]
MEPESRPPSFSFLNIPSIFTPSNSSFKRNSQALSSPSINNHKSTTNLLSSTSSWWPLRSASTNRYRKVVEEADEGLLSQSQASVSGIMDNIVVARNARRRMVWEMLALGALLAFLVGVVVLCMRGGQMRMADRILARRSVGDWGCCW